MLESRQQNFCELEWIVAFRSVASNAVSVLKEFPDSSLLKSAPNFYSRCLKLEIRFWLVDGKTIDQEISVNLA